MTKLFMELKRPENQWSAIARFPEMVRGSVFHWWPGELQIPSVGEYIVLGVSPICTYDLRLLDELEAKILAEQRYDIHVDVFDWTNLEPSVLGSGIKLQGDIYHTPLALIATGGRIVGLATGYAGRQLICEHYQLDITAILENLSGGPPAFS